MVLCLKAVLLPKKNRLSSAIPNPVLYSNCWDSITWPITSSTHWPSPLRRPHTQPSHRLLPSVQSSPVTQRPCSDRPPLAAERDVCCPVCWLVTMDSKLLPKLKGKVDLIAKYNVDLPFINRINLNCLAWRRVWLWNLWREKRALPTMNRQSM